MCKKHMCVINITFNIHTYIADVLISHVRSVDSLETVFNECSHSLREMKTVFVAGS